MEITKEHAKAVAGIAFLEQFVSGKKRLQVFLFYCMCKNKLLISDTKAGVRGATLHWLVPACESQLLCFENQCLTVGSLKSAMVGVFRLQKSEKKPINQSPLPSESQL